MDNISKALAENARNLTHEYQQGALNEGYHDRLQRERYELQRRRSETTGRRELRLTCGHRRTIDAGTYEERDMERTGTVQCRATKPVIGFPDHRYDFVGVLGWVGLYTGGPSHSSRRYET